jgi:NAD(P)-dependent dehydrogenase (short-subunit alcohol dehydrogenase family)
VVEAGAPIWFVTGASRGLGRAIAEEALSSGAYVVATARDARSLSDLRARNSDRVLALTLDVTDRDAVFSAVRSTVETWGSLDVLVNNAGYGLAGGVEEVTQQQARRQMEVNFFGALWCTQAVLPHMRGQRRGHIFQMSSIGGVTALANTGLYCASKFALEGLSESLSREVKAFGIGVTLVELGPFRTDWNGDSMERAEPMAAYDEVLGGRRESLSGAHAFTQPGDPRRAALALQQVVASPNPPLRLLLGRLAADTAPRVYEERLEEWREWDAVARSADFEAS